VLRSKPIDDAVQLIALKANAARSQFTFNCRYVCYRTSSRVLRTRGQCNAKMWLQLNVDWRNTIISHHWRTQSGGSWGGVKPLPVQSSEFFFEFAQEYCSSH